MSITARSAIGCSRDGVLKLTSSRLELPVPLLNYHQQVLESVNESLACNDGKYERNDGQSEDSKEVKEENHIGHHGDDTDHASAWGVQGPIRPELLSCEPSILTITPGNSLSSSRRISYPV